MEAIYLNKREEVTKLRKRIISSCKKCHEGFVPTKFSEEGGRYKYKECKCVDTFRYKKGLLLANVPRGKWDILDLEKRKILVTDPYDFKKKYGLYSKFINRYISSLDSALSDSIGLFMFGPPGSGKTTAAYHVIANAILKGRICYYIYLKNLIGLLIDSYEDSSRKPLFEEITKVEILVVDELSLVGRVTPHAVAEFTSICKERIERQTSTILISNYKDIEEIGENFGPPMESLMLEGFQGIRFYSKRDLREIKGERLQSFFR